MKWKSEKGEELPASVRNGRDKVDGDGVAGFQLLQLTWEEVGGVVVHLTMGV